MSDDAPVEPRDPRRNQNGNNPAPVLPLPGLPGEQARIDREQTLADTDQTLADTDQTLADSDQTSSDSDQTSSDRDQLAADEDQAASDRDLAHGGEPGVHEHSRDVRRRSAERRGQAALDRLHAARERDDSARARDLAALARDEAAAARDLAMKQLDSTDVYPRPLTGAEIVLRAADQRRRAAGHRARAAEQRTLAADDRVAAADDRKQGAHDRLHARADREALMRQLEIAETDAVTGARTRSAGLVELDRELERCRRTHCLMVVAYVDVVGLKALNDTAGHAAGDELLKDAVRAIKAHVRPYDLVVRLGGDEFLCAMPNMTRADARERFGQISAVLCGPSGAPTIRTGFAELTPHDTSTELIARADHELLAARG